MSWLDKVLEAAEEVTDVMDTAMNSNDDEVALDDLSQAGTEVLDGGVSNDPEENVYDKIDTYTQDELVGDEDVDGEKETDINSNASDVDEPKEEDAVAEEALSYEEMQQLYTESVTEVLSESRKAINARYRAKVQQAKLDRRKATNQAVAKFKKDVAQDYATMKNNVTQNIANISKDLKQDRANSKKNNAQNFADLKNARDKGNIRVAKANAKVDRAEELEAEKIAKKQAKEKAKMAKKKAMKEAFDSLFDEFMSEED